MSDQESLEDALDGLMDAVAYAESIGENKLSRDISSIYQNLSEASPDKHWDDVYYCSASGENIQETLEKTKTVFLVHQVSEDEFRFYTTDYGIKNLRNQDNVSDIRTIDTDST